MRQFNKKGVGITDRRREIIESVRGKAQKKTTFPDPRVSNQQKLEQIIELGLVWRQIHQIPNSKTLETDHPDPQILSNPNQKQQNKHQSKPIFGWNEWMPIVGEDWKVEIIPARWHQWKMEKNRWRSRVCSEERWKKAKQMNKLKTTTLKWPKGEEGLARKEERAWYRVPREHELLHWFLCLPPLGDCRKYIVFEKLSYLYFIPIVLKKIKNLWCRCPLTQHD